MADFEDWTAREPRKRPAACDEDALEADVFGAARDGPDDAADAAPAASGAAWHDDDDDVAVDLRSASRLRKLRKTTGDGVLDGGELESRLRERFAQQSGEAWAVDRKPARARGRGAAMEADDGGELRVERVADANVKLPGKASIQGSWLPDELKMNGTARAVAFGPAGSHLLYSSGGDAEVYVWDLRKNRCVEKFGDGRQRARCSLTTTVDTVVASEKIVAFSSKWAKDALRILHLPSLKVSPNWPTSKTPLHYVTALALNRDSSLLAIGNDRGKVLLYKLKNT
ncbi:U3 small nucleolar RNA-associated protein [Aureococcus anophagefferens]|uniref:U3 small nucleolar RNA-associated protein n=1 Tax=Aureococcus anophagefferens TaxID=44056 RepID=A0ABR1GCS8_AURAN